MLATLLTVLAAATPATAADTPCTRACKARVAHRRCDQQHPRWCVWHVIRHQKIRGWQRSWLLRVPACESTWNPMAVSSPTRPARSIPRKRSSAVYDHIWYWRKFLGDRKDQRCRRICQGSNGNVLIEFDDGYRTVAPRYSIRRAAR